MINKSKLTKLVSFLPALLIMIMIFSFSSEDSTTSTSTSQGFTKSLISAIDTGFHLNLSDLEEIKVVNSIEHFVRKVAHFTEYMLLAISIIVPLYLQKVRPKYFVPGTEIFCILYATSDEIHQLFISGRAARATDVLIDSMGSLTGIALVVLIIYLRKKHLHKI